MLESNMHSKDICSNSEICHTSKSWIDDLPVCKKSGIGVSTNQIYCTDGSQQEEHPFEDRSFYCQLDNATYLYGVFDGHMGARAADFGLQRMAAEILLGQLIEKRNDEEIKEVLRQAYISVEKGYLDSIDDLLAERTSLQCEIPEGLPAFDAYQKYPHIFEKLKSINYQLSSATSAVVALIYNNKLYVANVGNSRALLCKTDANAVLRVVQLSVDHDLRNEDELLRLLQLGVRNVKYGSQLGNQETTRCIGNYLVKGGYREYESLKNAITEPVIAVPEIYGGIEIDESCRFLLVMSAGLYKSLEEVIPVNEVNKYIAQLVVEQFRMQQSLNSVAQAVVHKVVHLHHNSKISNPHGILAAKREDITLIIRNFNFPLLRTVQSSNLSDSCTNSTRNSTISSTNTSRSEDIFDGGITNDIHSSRRIKPYVDFSVYYNNMRRLRET